MWYSVRSFAQKIFALRVIRTRAHNLVSSQSARFYEALGFGGYPSVSYETQNARYTLNSPCAKSSEYRYKPVIWQVSVPFRSKKWAQIDEIIRGTWPITVSSLITATANGSNELPCSRMQGNFLPTTAVQMFMYTCWSLTIASTENYAIFDVIFFPRPRAQLVSSPDLQLNLCFRVRAQDLASRHTKFKHTKISIIIGFSYSNHTKICTNDMKRLSATFSLTSRSNRVTMRYYHSLKPHNKCNST